jgi:pSer/pThr/pTyr-binding forkhead associated (FHA) protein
MSEVDPAAPVGLTPDETAAVHALPPTSALLVMQRGPAAGARFLLDAERTSAGRSTRSDIFLDDVTVSRQHAEFVRDGNQFWVRDVGSLNGTYVNRTRIDQVVLRGGDEVQIGKFRMVFYPSPQREAAGA